MKDILFAAFDLFPSPKGAATHISHNLRAAQELFAHTMLLCLGAPDMPRYQEEGTITVRRSLLNHPNYLRRAELYQEFVATGLSQCGPQQVIYFRDIWSGLALLDHPAARQSKFVFEVNGFPSIELPYHYPLLYRRPALRQMLAAMETECLQRADAIVTVSEVNARYVERRGVATGKITVIPNCVNPGDMSKSFGHESVSEKRIILYAGTLTFWQGVQTLIKAYAYLAKEPSVELVLACSSRKHFRSIRKLIHKLDLSDRVRCLWALTREALDDLYAQATVSVAPLARCDRNEVQGCCPLKIIESMAMGTPVIASDLPVCRELIESGKDGYLVTPDAPRALAQAIRHCLDEPDRVAQLGRNARNKIALTYHFDIIKCQWQQRLNRI